MDHGIQRIRDENDDGLLGTLRHILHDVANGLGPNLGQERAGRDVIRAIRVGHNRRASCANDHVGVAGVVVSALMNVCICCPGNAG